MRWIKYILVMFVSCLTQSTICAQAIIDVGAIVETKSQLWTLKRITRYTDSLAVDWEIKGKVANAEETISQREICLKDYKTGIKHVPLKSLLRTKIQIREKFQTDSIRIVFPAIKDTTSLFSIYLSPTILVDSITLPSSNNSLISDVRYKVPFCKGTLTTRSDSINFSDSLFALGMKNYKNKLFQEAIICFEKCHTFDKLLVHYSLLSPLRIEYDYYSKMWLAHCYYKIGNEEKAKLLDSDYALEPFDRKLTFVSDSIRNVVWESSYKPNSDFQHIQEYRKICNYDSIALGSTHHRYARSLFELGQVYSSYRHFSEAKSTLWHSYKIITDLQENNWLGKTVLRELAKIAYEEEDYISAIRYMEKSLGIGHNNCDFSSEPFLFSEYASLVTYYTKAGNWNKALSIAKNRVSFWEAEDLHDFSNRWKYMNAADDYALLLSKSGRHKDAFRVYNRLVEFDNSKWRLMQLGLYYHDLRDYQSALSCYQSALKDSSTLISHSYQNQLAICYWALGDKEKAIRAQKECIAKTNPEHLSYSNIYNGYASYTTELSNLASFFNGIEQFDSALVYEKQSLNLKEKYFSPHSDDIAYSYMNLGIAYGGKRIWEKAVEYLKFSYDIYKKQRQKVFYHRALSYLSKLSFDLGEYTNLVKYTSEYLNSAREDLLSTFQELTYDERSRYIEEYSNLMNTQIPMYAYYTNSDSLVSMAFNASLMMKGALLSSENGVKRVIEESGDVSLIDLWEELRANRYILSKRLGTDSTESRLNIDSLQRVINKKEDSLIVRCKEYGDITHSMQLKWNDIQQHLRHDDIAIEFLSFPINNDSIVYAALALRKDSDRPQLVSLFEEKQLKQVSDTLYYQCKEMTDLIWKPLLSELQGIKNIYFSPAGALYNIGIEYLSGMEKYNIYRLSSTRELVTVPKTESENQAVLYGGLDYYATLGSSSVNRPSRPEEDILIEHANVRGMKLRGGKELLPQTKIEVEQISKELNKAQWKYELLTDREGTEESFKSYSGKRLRSLHLSTHGFYYTSDEAENVGYDFLRLDNHVASAEDKALTRSGLILSGANHILEGEELPANVEDGILTAKEIADVDLRGLDLVVLSACQTGLGDISQGEGVFGLQRGFKKAGANSILMSLWEVDDKATQLLMTQFYRYLLAGQNKRQSLLSAQKYLREADNGRYNEPKYWAAFILLDGKS